MKTKIIFSVLCAAFVSFGSLYARGQKSEGPTELLWYGIGLEPPDVPDVFGELSSELKNMGRNYSIQYQSFDWGEHASKLQLILAAGERADILFMASWSGNYLGNATSGYLTELDELLEAQPKLKATMGPAFWDAARVTGKIYAVPNYKDMVYQEYSSFNEELLQKHNISLPKTTTWKNVTPILERIAKLEPDYVPYDSVGGVNIRGHFILGYQVPIILSFAEPEKGFQVLTEVPEFQAQVRLMRQWAERGYFDKDAYLKEGTTTALKKNFFMRTYQGFPGAEVGVAQSYGMPIQVRLHEAPAVLDSNTPLGSVLTIPAASQNAEQAMDFIALLNTEPKVRNLVGYGIEGVHYNLDGNGQVVRTEKGKNNYEMPNFAMGSLLVLTPLQGEPLDVRDQLRTFNESAQASPAIGFPVDKEKYSSEIAQVAAAFGPYRGSFQYGLRPADEALEEARDKLRELGWFEVVADINKSYMEWKNSQ